VKPSGVPGAVTWFPHTALVAEVIEGLALSLACDMGRTVVWPGGDVNGTSTGRRFDPKFGAQIWR